MTLWLVRAGKYGEREDLALDNNLAIIGFDNVPDMSNVKQRSDLASMLALAHPEVKPKTLSNWESQLWAFVYRIQIDDIVVLPLKTRSSVALGRVTGGYEYKTKLLHNVGVHTRPVKWIKELPKNKFRQDLLYSFGAFMTVCRIQRNNAEERLLNLLAGQNDIIAKTTI